MYGDGGRDVAAWDDCWNAENERYGLRRMGWKTGKTHAAPRRAIFGESMVLSLASMLTAIDV